MDDLTNVTILQIISITLVGKRALPELVVCGNEECHR